MSDKKHTAEPWEIGQYDWLIQEAEKDGIDGEVAQVNSHRPEYAENARRIVAAINATKLLPTAGLEANCIERMLIALGTIMIAGDEGSRRLAKEAMQIANGE